MQSTVLLAVIIVFFLFCGSARGAEEYTLGVVPQFEQRKLHAVWDPIAAEAGKRAGLTLRVVSTMKIKDFEKEFLDGTYDFLFLNPYHQLMANAKQGYIPLIRDRNPLQGILVVQKDSKLRTPAELNGKTVALPSPNALGASLLMRADLERLFQVKIDPLYVHTHSAVYLHVLQGLAVAGGGVAKTLVEQDEAVQKNLRVLYATREMPSHPLSVHPRVPAEARAAMQSAFLEMGADATGRSLLFKVPIQDVVAATMDDYSPMRQWGLDSFYAFDAED